MKRNTSFVLYSILCCLLCSSYVYSHCEIPCGIYGDELRLQLIGEHITTIEKSMSKIEELAAAEKKNPNQIVRWVNNKEEHATRIQHIVQQYFLAQRVKPVDSSNAEAQEKYMKQLTLLHEMIIYSMKAKQTTDSVHIQKLRTLLDDFSIAYLGRKTN